MSTKELATIFNLVSSDNVSVPESLSQLCSHSATFRDLFDLASDSASSDTCDVSETNTDLKLFLAAIGGEERKYELE